MRGYLSVLGTDSGAIPVESRVEIYRDPGETHEIIARTREETHRLGVRDVTVSRLKGDTTPVIIEPRPSHIEIRNERNTSGLTVVHDGDTADLQKGRMTTVDGLSKIIAGHQTKFRLTVEQEAKTEINVGGDISGDLVAGNQRNVDKSTNVEDSVLNRSTVNGDGGAEVDDSVLDRSSVSGDSATEVKDSVLNRSNVGGKRKHDTTSESDTQKRCKVHDRMYSEDVCPECAVEKEGTSGETRSIVSFVV